jgi:hypothetical protein
MWKRKEYHSVIRSLVVIALISYLLALGENFPLYRIFSVFPVIKSFRFPARWLAGTELSVMVLSGFGVLAFSEFLSRKKHAADKKDGKSPKQTKNVSDKIIPLALAAQYKLSVALSVLVAIEIFCNGRKKQVVQMPEYTYLLLHL